MLTFYGVVCQLWFEEIGSKPKSPSDPPMKVTLPAYIDDNTMDLGANQKCPHPVIERHFIVQNQTPWQQRPLEDRLQCIEAGLHVVLQNHGNAAMIFCGAGFQFQKVPESFVHNPALLELIKKDKAMGIASDNFFDEESNEMLLFQAYSGDHCEAQQLDHLVTQLGKEDGRSLLASLVNTDVGLHSPLLPPEMQEGIINCLPQGTDLPPMKGFSDYGEFVSFDMSLK